MSFNLYISNCNGFVDELRKMLSNEDIEILRDYFKEFGYDAVIDGFAKNWTHISKFATMIPSKRPAYLKKIKPTSQQRALLIFLSMLFVLYARKILHACEEFDVREGCPYREMTLRAANAFVECSKFFYAQWPLPGKSPFV